MVDGPLNRRLPTAAIEIGPVDRNDPDARLRIRSYFAERDRRSEPGFDPDAGISAEPRELVPRRG